MSFLGIISTAAGFVNDKIVIILMRALMGIGKWKKPYNVGSANTNHSVCDVNPLRSRTVGAGFPGTS